jgi:uncharacterized protein (DUF1684 family)
MTAAFLAIVLIAAAPPDDDAAARLKTWRAEQDARMRAPTSPLARLGPKPLVRGHNVLGSGPADTLRFSVAGMPASVADFVWEEGMVRLTPLLPVALVDGQPAVAGPLRWGSKITIEPLTFALEGGPQAAYLSVWDISLPQFMQYQGLKYLPDDRAFRIPATFTPAEGGRTLVLDTSTGGKKTLPHKGTLHFTLEGKDLSLDAFASGEHSNELFVIFKDASSGHETYGPGRFVWVPAAVDGKTVIDFNLAWNPLCAYSHHFNCPLAPPQNHLPIRVPVGEATYPLGDH